MTQWTLPETRPPSRQEAETDDALAGAARYPSALRPEPSVPPFDWNLRPGTLHQVILRGLERRPIVADDQDREAQALMRRRCRRAHIGLEELRMGSRRPIAAVRSGLAVTLVTRLGLSLAEAARQLGISTSGSAKAVARAEQLAPIRK